MQTCNHPTNLHRGNTFYPDGNPNHPVTGWWCAGCGEELRRVPEFDRESYARSHGWTLAQLEEFETTYGVNAEELETKRLRDDAEFKALPSWERAPDTYRQG
jgi:hypothetical protein